MTAYRGKPRRVRSGDNGQAASRGSVYGALDLGTNNCRLMIASPMADGIRVIESFSRIVRLGEGLRATGLLGEAAVERTVRALRICSERLQRRHVRHIRCIATEACRKAANRDDFFHHVATETGLTLEAISAEEEAALTLGGCLPLLDRTKERGLIFDIGGGSTELSWVDMGDGGAPRLLGFMTMGIGVVNLAEEFGTDRIAPAAFEEIVARVDAEIAGFDAEHGIGQAVAAGDVQMLGTSGTVTTLGGVHLGLPRYDRSRVDGMVIDFAALLAASAQLAALDFLGRAANPCIGRQRADLVVVGCAILEAICRRWPVGCLRIADRGVREGLLLSLMAADAVAMAGHL